MGLTQLKTAAAGAASRSAEEAASEVNKWGTAHTVPGAAIRMVTFQHLVQDVRRSLSAALRAFLTWRLTVLT